jgi:hypothetical protein
MLEEIWRKGDSEFLPALKGTSSGATPLPLLMAGCD